MLSSKGLWVESSVRRIKSESMCDRCTSTETVLIHNKLGSAKELRSAATELRNLGLFAAPKPQT